MRIRILPFVAALLATGAAFADDGLQQVTLEHYLSASVSSSQTFRCFGSGRDDARIEYESKVLSPTDRRARITSLSVKGISASAALLSELAGDVGEANITGAMIGCSSRGIQVTIHTFGRIRDARTGEDVLADGVIHLYLHEGAEQLTRE